MDLHTLWHAPAGGGSPLVTRAAAQRPMEPLPTLPPPYWATHTGAKGDQVTREPPSPWSLTSTTWAAPGSPAPGAKRRLPIDPGVLLPASPRQCHPQAAQAAPRQRLLGPLTRRQRQPRQVRWQWWSTQQSTDAPSSASMASPSRLSVPASPLRSLSGARVVNRYLPVPRKEIDRAPAHAPARAGAQTQRRPPVPSAGARWGAPPPPASPTLSKHAAQQLRKISAHRQRPPVQHIVSAAAVDPPPPPG